MSSAAAELRECVGPDSVLDDAESLEFYSQDVYRSGQSAVAVVRPANRDEVSQVVARASRLGLAVHVRGGGMSYTDAYLPESDRAIVLDVSRLDRVLEWRRDELLAHLVGLDLDPKAALRHLRAAADTAGRPAPRTWAEVVGRRHVLVDLLGWIDGELNGPTGATTAGVER